MFPRIPPDNLPVESAAKVKRRSPIKRAAHPTRTRPFSPTSRDLDIVRLVQRFRFLQPRHLHAALGGSAQQIARRAAELYHAGYLARPQHQLFGGEYRGQIIYAVTNLGARAADPQQSLPYLADYSENNRTATNAFMAHTVATADFLITLELGAAAYGYKVRQWYGRGPAPSLGVRLGDEEARFQADALVWLEHPRRGEIPHFIEIDRSTITLERMHERYLKYYLWRKTLGPRAHLGRDDFRVLTVTKTPERMDTLRATAATVGQREPWRGFFFAHAGAFDMARPHSITERIFHFATDEAPVSLLE